MKLYNTKFLNTSEINTWNFDSDGFLRVTASILAEGVFNYLSEESPPTAKAFEGRVPHFISRDEFTPEALKTLEGKSVVIQDHTWQNVNTHPEAGEHIVGCVAGTPRAEDGYLIADLLITDKDTIKKVADKELVEVSAAYTSDCTVSPGVYKETPYQVLQHGMEFNHVLLLPKGEGRCGQEARILNKKEKRNMSATQLNYTFGAKKEVYRFSNSEDAAEAQRLNEDQKVFNGTELEEALGKVKELKQRLDDLTAEYNENLRIVHEQKEHIERLLSPESQATLVEEALSQQQDEQDIIEDALDTEVLNEEEAEDISQKIKNAKTYNDRRKALVEGCLKEDASRISSWEPQAVEGAFELLASQARRRMLNKKRSVMGGVRASGVTSQVSTLDRLFRPYKVQSTK